MKSFLKILLAVFAAAVLLRACGPIDVYRYLDLPEIYLDRAKLRVIFYRTFGRVGLT